MRAAKTYDSNGSSAIAWGEGRGKRAAEITAHALDMGPHGAFAVIPCTYGVLGRLRSWPRKRGAKSNSRRPSASCTRWLCGGARFARGACGQGGKCKSSPSVRGVRALLRLPKPSTQRLQAACRHFAFHITPDLSGPPTARGPLLPIIFMSNPRPYFSFCSWSWYSVSSR
jgi:hypothetical protein